MAPSSQKLRTRKREHASVKQANERNMPQYPLISMEDRIIRVGFRGDITALPKRDYARIVCVIIPGPLCHVKSYEEPEQGYRVESLGI